ncbi:MAG TPA: polysaccharide biosynthesis tyrosine autokinase [Rhodanobacteraceae bacterium]|jgi:tyrosine-protein kinase Etk/Wzc|nr:polysaccharide biosynthesis tyrosine autokinase [Rhodanobacteraceae bacterium]
MTPTQRLEYSRSAFIDARALPIEQTGEEIDLRALLGTLIDHKRLILTVTAIFFVLGLAYVFLARPVYEASALLQVEQAPTLPGITAVEQAVGASNPESTDAVSILTSYSVVKNAVDALNLNIVVAPYRVPFIGQLAAQFYTPARPGDVAGAWPGLGRYDWGGSHLDVQQLDVPTSMLGQELTLVAGKDGSYTLRKDGLIPFVDGRVLLQGRVGETVKHDGITMRVAKLDANPGTHFSVTRNNEATTIAGLQASINAQPAQQGSNVIALTLDGTNPNLAVRILDYITQAFLAQNVGRNSAQSANSLKFVQKQLPVVKKRLEAAQAALNAYQIKAHSVDVPMQTQSLLTEMNSVDDSLRQLETQKLEAARLYTPQHPAYKAIVNQIAMLRSRKSAMQSQMNTLPDTQRELLRLNGNVQVLDTTYNGLLNEEQQLEISQAGAVGTARIVDQPSVDITSPAKPKKLITVAGSTVAGGVLALAFVFLRQFMKRGVEDPAEIEQLGLPVYTAIPLSEQQLALSQTGPRLFARRRQRLLALAAPEDIAAEALRSLRTSLYFTTPDAADNRIMICGSSPNAGKTFVSANLAAINAQAGQRVLLIDANMRDGKLHTILGGRAEHGLSELLADRIILEEAIRLVDDVDNLHFIPAGRRPPNPSELLMRPRFASLLDKLSPQYDLIVIDSPPILSVTDATIIGHHVGTSLLVVRFGLNQSREVEMAMQRFRQSGVEIKGVVFNGMERRSGGFNAYGYQGDGYVQ